MEKPSPAPRSNSQPALTKLPAWAQRILARLDPDFPSVVIEPVSLAIADPARYGDERLKPDFVVADDLNFTGVQGQ